MSNIRYHQVIPSNNKFEFNPEDLVDFELDAFGRSLVRNSIEISGTIQVFKTVAGGQSRVIKGDAGSLFLDKNAGAHSVCENVSCSTVNQGNLESIGFSYPRYVSMLNVLQKRSQDKNNVEDAIEWVYPDKGLTDNYLRQGLLSDGTNTENYDQTFNFKPHIVFNRTDQNVPFSRTGKMRISMNLSSVEKMIEDKLTVANIESITYKIKELKLFFRSVPEDQSVKSILAQKFTPLKTTISSSLANMSLNVPSQSATGCSISFQNVANEGVKSKNNSQLEKINISGLQFFFNSANTYLNYKLDNLSEILIRGLKSISPSNDEATYEINNKDLGNNENFIVGSDMDGIIDLSENSFEVQIESDLNTNTNVYFMFHSLISM
jgi:hypothetical protein